MRLGASYHVFGSGLGVDGVALIGRMGGWVSSLAGGGCLDLCIVISSSPHLNRGSAECNRVMLPEAASYHVVGVGLC